MTSGIKMKAFYVVLCYNLLHSVDCSRSISPCQRHQLDAGNKTVRMDCRQRKFSTLSGVIFPSNTVDLDLSLNKFTVFHANAFKELPNLLRLNISQNEIRVLSADTFEGLVHLEVLDMKNNPVVATGLPQNIFNRLPSLRRLQISGSVTTDEKLSTYGTLHSLEEITITPDMKHMPYSLAKLEKLTAIYFAFCQNSSILTRDLIHPFNLPNIKELAFVSCELNSISRDTFDGFSYLKTLNLAGNRWLDFNTVIDTLSSSRNVTVSTLILDMISYNYDSSRHPDYPRCRKAWRHLERLSIRGLGINYIGRFSIQCILDVSRIAVGFNPYSKIRKYHLSGITIAKLLVAYADFSFLRYNSVNLLKAFIGYYVEMGFVRRNDDYFIAPLELTDSHEDANNTDISVYSKPDNCNALSIPSRLTYITLAHAVLSYGSVDLYTCIYVYPNNLRYIDLSYGYAGKVVNITFNPVIYGFLKLEVLRLAGMQLYDINMATLHNCPSLRILDVQSNSLGLGPLKVFPSMPRLQELHFSNNLVTHFPNDMFMGLTSLQRLILSRNKLDTLNFNLPDQLEYLDISENRFAFVDLTSRRRIDHLPHLVMRLDNNPLQCECTDSSWIEWYQSTRTEITNKELLTCKHYAGHRAVVDADVARLKLTCGITVNKVVLSGVSICQVICVLVGGLLLYRYRWTIRWRYYQLCFLRRKRNNNEMLLTEANIQHSAYVIYNNEDDLSREWVVRTLVPGVEDNLQKPHMFIKDRDELVGKSKVDEIMRGLDSSRTAIWVVCPAFYECSMCEMASYFSISKFGMSNILCVILENRLECYRDGRKFKRLVDSSVGIKCVRFSDNEDGMRIFWNEIDRFLPDLI